MRKEDWYHNEFKQMGTDYNSIDEIKLYDERMRQIRDVDREVHEALAAMELKSTDIVMDIGCGTGEFSIAAARNCGSIIAIDISDKMLEYAELKSKRNNINNINYIKGGFLTYEYTGPPINAVFSSLALHHLPDFWKTIALSRIFRTLNSNGVFYFNDVVYSFNHNNYEKRFIEWTEVHKIIK